MRSITLTVVVFGFVICICTGTTGNTAECKSFGGVPFDGGDCPPPTPNPSASPTPVAAANQEPNQEPPAHCVDAYVACVTGEGGSEASCTPAYAECVYAAQGGGANASPSASPAANQEPNREPPAHCVDAYVSCVTGEGGSEAACTPAYTECVLTAMEQGGGANASPSAPPTALPSASPVLGPTDYEEGGASPSAECQRTGYGACFESYEGNGVCDPACYNEPCGWDKADCGNCGPGQWDNTMGECITVGCDDPDACSSWQQCEFQYQYCYLPPCRQFKCVKKQGLTECAPGCEPGWTGDAWCDDACT